MTPEKKPRKPRKSACKQLKIVLVPGEPLSATEAEELEEALARFLVDTYRAKHGSLLAESPAINQPSPNKEGAGAGHPLMNGPIEITSAKGQP